jgi:hypothetical protein
MESVKVVLFATNCYADEGEREQLFYVPFTDIMESIVDEHDRVCDLRDICDEEFQEEVERFVLENGVPVEEEEKEVVVVGYVYIRV